MKRKLLVAFIFISTFAINSCGPLTTVVPSTTVEKVINVDNKSKYDIYIIANNWMVSAFNADSESRLSFNDKEAGEVSGKYTLKYFPETGFRIFASINIKCKDNKAKISITPMEYSYGNMSGDRAYTPAKRNTDINNLISSFEKALTNDNDW